MKIGILTFHWAANHGAVLQTYATMKYLQQKGADPFVIDYYPRDQEYTWGNALRPARPRVVLGRIEQVRKNKKISPFRDNLILSQRYISNQELIDNPPWADVYIAGSDQIWNPYYVRYGENKVTPVYFLNFGPENSKKVGMSVSFGCTEYPDDAAQYVRPLLKDFSAISAREKTGLEILSNMGYGDGIVTADPTSLLDRNTYLELCETQKKTDNTVAICILRKQSKENQQKIRKLRNKFKDCSANYITNKSMPQWLAGIRDSVCVITNSFHCVMMCLKLHTPFVVLPEDGKNAGMNDRLYTLLEKFSLQNRIYSGLELPTMNAIDWNAVDRAMDRYSYSLMSFLSTNVLGEK